MRPFLPEFLPEFLPKLLLLLVSVAVAIGLGEAACRQWLGEKLRIETDERNLFYGFDSTLGWFPRPSDADRSFVGEREIAVRHNSMGLRDEEVGPNTAGRPRIAFFGDSFVWGYDANVGERMTDLLRARHPEWDVVNCGVSGYGTDQAFLLWQRLAPLLKPDIVVLLFNRADRNDNILAENNGGYGKPVFLIEKDGMRLANVPVPLLAKARVGESWLYRNSLLWRLLMTKAPEPKVAVFEDPSERIVDRWNEESAAAGARLVLLIEGKDAEMVAYARAKSIPLAETEPALSEGWRTLGALRYTGHGAHWTPEGNKLVATLLEPVLVSALQDRDHVAKIGPR